MEEKEITKYQDFSDSIEILTKQYFANGKFEISTTESSELDTNTSVRFVHLSKFVYEKDINIIDKLSSVYSALYSIGASVILKIVSNGKQCDLYIGVKKSKDVVKSFKVLKGALEGNFPGTTFTKDSLSNQEIQKLKEDTLGIAKEVTCVLGVPSLKDKETHKDKDKFVQGIENFIIAMQGKEFSAMFIADPISTEQIEEYKGFYESMYTNLFPLKEQTFGLNENESNTLTNGITETINESISKGYSSSESTSKVPNILGYLYRFINVYNIKLRKWHLENEVTGQKTKGITKTITEGTSSSKSESEAKTTGKGRSIQYTAQNKTIDNLLSQLDIQFERLKKGDSLGLWNVGAYFTSEEQQNSIVAANIYNGIIKGEDTGVQKSNIYTYSHRENKQDFNNIVNSLQNYEIPRVNKGMFNTDRKLATVSNTSELSLQMSLPSKSFVGLDVVQTVPFGNNIKTSEEQKISVGKLYNYEKEFPIDFSLDIDKFTGHIFVTGSTGSGKSNVTYNLLNELIEKGIKFMVIEPAKGEYKDVFHHSAQILGTNVNKSNLLKINPFSFPEDIHIYEHIDRLIEILNAVWPMYAAMPAMLKSAIEDTYKSKGWDLLNSNNIVGKRVFPTFEDLARILPNTIKQSDFSEEIKSNYSGALVTRVNSLTNGVYKLIFGNEEISDNDLFNNNTIVDLSRVSSTETKSLLMGILFMKLQEYRMTENITPNSKLRHVTIIEEAHNLLKKVSSEQSQESSNLQGKSVEMLSNAIAEMRTYGQGFILADQAPGLLDPSVIRNTNTKICLRLPAKDDREMVGKAMNLTDDQINELARLKTGVAAVYQNDWQESVLCKFNYFNSPKDSYSCIKVFESKKKVTKFLAKQLMIAYYDKEPLNEKGLNKCLKYNNYNIIAKKLKLGILTKDEIREDLTKILEANSILEVVLCMETNEYNKLQIFRNSLLEKWGLENYEFVDELIGLVLHECALALNKKDVVAIYNEYLNIVKLKNIVK